MLTIIGVLTTNLILTVTIPVAPDISVVPITNLVSSAGSNFVVVADRINLVASNAVFNTGYQLASSIPATYRISHTNIAAVVGYELVYRNDGATILLISTANGTFTRKLSFVQDSTGLFTNFYAFAGGTIGSNVNYNASNLFGGNVATAEPNGTWNLYSNFSDVDLNANRWATGLDFSGFISRGMGGDRPVSLITSRHGISCMHAWDWTAGSQVFAVGTNGVRYTNWIQSTASMGDDCRLVTFSNNFPDAVSPFYILPTNWSSKITPPNWNVVWYRANTRHVATSQTLLPGVTNYIQANLAAVGSAFNETVASGGDSGGPMWLVLSNRLIFTAALHTASVSGPFISNQRYYTNIVTAIGTNALRVVDISAYP